MSITVRQVWDRLKNRCGDLTVIPFTLIVILLVVIALVGLRYYVDVSLELENGGIGVARIGQNQYRRTLHASEGVTDTGIRIRKGDHVTVRASGRTSTSVSAYPDMIGMLWVYTQWEILSYCLRPGAHCEGGVLSACGRWAKSSEHWTAATDDDWNIKSECTKQFDEFRMSKQLATVAKAERSSEGINDNRWCSEPLCSAIKDCGDLWDLRNQRVDGVIDADEVERQRLCLKSYRSCREKRGCGDWLERRSPEQQNEWNPLLGKLTFADVLTLAREAEQLFTHMPADADGESLTYVRSPQPAKNGRPFPHFEDDDGMYCPYPHGRLVAWVCEGESPTLCQPRRDPKRCAHSGKAMDFVAEQDGKLWVVVNDSTRFAASNTGLLVLEVAIDKKWYLQLWKPSL